jgi:glycosyltransferase involved in cell wall biosynthesis
MATGNGAYVVHKNLEQGLKNYYVVPYNPYLTLVPPVLFGVGRLAKADLIHTAMDYGLFHKRARVPLVLTLHNYVLDRFMQGYSSPLQNIHYQTDLKWITRLGVKKASVITAVSQYTAELASRELALEQPVRVIYNGIDQHRFYPKPNHRINDKQIKVLYCGNLTRRKGIHWLASIVEKLPNNISVFYTSGLRGKNKFFDNTKLQCIGSIPYAQMPDIYNAMDVLLFPTVREGFGLAAAEAMACGVPVVATNGSSLPELIDDGKGGFLCTLGDVAVFVERLKQLAEDAVLRKQMGEFNRNKIEQTFTLDKMLKAYQALFTEVLDNRNNDLII